MKLEFTKMHGIGNDYIYVNCLKKEIENPDCVAITVSDRHFGIGSDGLVLILKSSVADFKMRMFNTDGSEGKMCGNAIRCVAKYVYDNKFTDKTNLKIETLSGIKTLTLSVLDNKVSSVMVDMGKAEFVCSKIPVISDTETFINMPVNILSTTDYITCVSMGNPHAVIFTENINKLKLEEIGPYYENYKMFPQRINTEFVQILNEKTLRMRVWERGSGETYACGTGACAVVAASVANGICKAGEEITVMLKGGELKITCMPDNTVFMKGTATKVFDGVMEL